MGGYGASVANQHAQSDGSPDIEVGSLVVAPSGDSSNAVQEDPQAAAFFDIDNTVIRGASIFALARGLLKEDILKRTDMLGFAWKQAKFLLAGTEDLDDIAKVQESALAIVKGRSVEEMRAISRDVFDQYMADKVFPGTIALADFHQNAGQRVWLVSATPIEVAEVIADKLGLSGAIGTRSEIDGGVYTGRLIGYPVHGQAKADAVRALAKRENLDLARCSAYSDSANDIPMLSLVGNPCAINPDHKLRMHAQIEGWQMRDFRSTRLALKIGVPSAAVGGAILGALVGSLVTAHSHRNRS
ncbi:MAG: HAD-IB family hydrolase [Actinobacteria bacterium]|nr:HAD-IB family hydrolase [Actinomycetota bacterium]